MAFKDRLNYSETMLKHKIVFKTKWIETLNSVVFYFAGVSFIFYMCLTAYEISKTDNPSLIGYGLIVASLIFAFFIGYKKLFEKKLRIIQTNLTKADARKAIKTIAETSQWKILYDNSDFLQGCIGHDITSWGKVVTILYDSNKIHVNVLSDNPLIRMPLLFADKSIKGEIEKQLKANP